MNMQRRISAFIIGIVLGVIPSGAIAQEPEASPIAAEVPSYDYLIAYSNPVSTEQAAQALDEFNAGEARILLLVAGAGLDLPPDFAKQSTKPVLVAGRLENNAVRIESDSYLSIANDPSGMAVGQLQRMRRETRASRWSVGLSAHYLLLDDARLDLVLFRDDPLDILFVGNTDVLQGQPQGKHPFGRSTVVSPPNDGSVLLMLFSVSDSGIAPHVLPSTETASPGNEPEDANEGGTTP